ncbi:MAG: glycogen/starch synthase [Myxococcales bacterium]
MDILFVSPSLSPYPVESGPSEACAALSKALRSLGHRISILAPYPEEPDPNLSGLARRLDPIRVDLGSRAEAVHVHDGRSAGGVEWILLQHPALSDLFEIDESALFAQAVLARATEQLLARERAFDAVHFHGEETALAAALVASTRRFPVIFSAYSLANPLRFSARQTHALGLEAFADQDGTVCPLLWAIQSAQRVSTSLPERVLASAPSEDDALVARALKARGGALSAVPFGLDSALWNPLTDVHLVARYTPHDLTGKARCKAMLQRELKLEIDPDVALLGAVESAFGAERIERIAKDLVRTDVQLVLQVLDEDAGCIDALIALSDRMPHRLQVRIGDSQLRTHRIVSGSDALLITSERPVLAMAAQRYGTLPVARRGSASAESVVDIDAKLATGTGILYDDRSSEALLAGARRAVAAFNRGLPFEKLRTRMMRTDFSWERAARMFELIYQQAVSNEAA